MERTIHGAAVSFGALFGLVSPAFAEVCDKVAPEWNPSDGPVTIAQEFYWAIVSPFGVAIAVIIVASIVFRRSAIGYVVGALALMLATLMGVLGGDALMAEASIREGCKTGYPAREMVYAVLGMAAVVVGWTIQKNQKNV